ncbi:hypothetical protein BH10BAC5_BH10BAC5_12430 [soil metagenome]
MKTTLKPLAIAVIVAIFTTASIFSLNAKSETKKNDVSISKNITPILTADSLDEGNGEDEGGGPKIPPDPKF